MTAAVETSLSVPKGQQHVTMNEEKRAESASEQLTTYDYSLPSDRIAQNPVRPRDASKLLFLSRQQNGFDDFTFPDLPALLKKGDLLVFNDTKVIPARIRFERGEILLVRRTEGYTEQGECWDCLIYPARNFKPGMHFEFSANLRATVLSQTKIGRLIQFDGDVERYLKTNGEIPLPPYIERAVAPADRRQYQTIYARMPGSVAAPTAGLHFTKRIFRRLKECGIDTARITLHVGPGTFRPVKQENILNHQIDAEYYRCTEATWEKIGKATRVVVVGTTTTRALETIARTGELAGFTDLFIYPGFQFKVVEGLVTNFHLPKSSLLMLVAAFAGLDLTQKAYRHAVEYQYRFYSYGDAMLIL